MLHVVFYRGRKGLRTAHDRRLSNKSERNLHEKSDIIGFQTLAAERYFKLVEVRGRRERERMEAGGERVGGRGAVLGGNAIRPLPSPASPTGLLQLYTGPDH